MHQNQLDMTSSWEYKHTLISNREECDNCEGNLIWNHQEASEVTVYTRQGTEFGQHKAKLCPNRFCNAQYGMRFKKKSGIKVYEKINEKAEYLMLSANTAFEIPK